MKTVKHILHNKVEEVYSVTKETSVFEALNFMMQKNISAVLIIEDKLLKGIFTERDYARKIILQGKSSKETKIQEVMTPSLIVVKPDDTIEFCMELMTERHIRHLPVVNGEEEVIGMISIGDVVKSVITDQKLTIQQLENYINS